MHRFISITLGVALLSLPALSQTDGHARWHHWYQTWKQPNGSSCCNARIIYPGGAEIGDCEPTRYEIRDGHWYAWERHTEQWLKVPDDKIIHERNPSGEEGHLCWTPHGGILCAVPPDLSG